jgi:serine/threonine protein kinase
MSTFKNYNIIKSLGKGGQAEVFLAEDNRFLSKVAIKILSPELTVNANMSQRFIAEARNMFQMSHQNIIRVTDLIEEDGKKAFVMEYIEGNNLRDEAERLAPLSTDVIRNWMSQILAALEYCHSKGMIHRDIKPSNFMLTAQGQVKLLDFGIAKNTESNTEYTQTGTSQMMGTPIYMSPEQILETKSVDLRSDIYSVGVVLWQFVTGKKPYDTQTLSSFQVQTKIVNEPLPSTGTKFDEIISKCTAKDPANRFQNCADAQKELDKIFNNSKNVSKADHTNISSVDDEKTTIVSAPVSITPSAPIAAPKDIKNLNPPTSFAYPFPPAKKPFPILLVMILVVVSIIAAISIVVYQASDEIFDTSELYKTPEQIQLDSIYDNTPGITKTESGLMYVILENGNGFFSDENDNVRVNYRGTLINGELIGSNEELDPDEFNISETILGFKEGIQLVSEGGRIRMFIPSNLAYGSQGSGLIPGNSIIIYEIELLEVLPNYTNADTTSTKELF